MVLTKALWPLTTSRVGVMLAVGLLVSAAVASAQEVPKRWADRGALVMAPGDIRTVRVSELIRVAIGDPKVADITVISPSEVLIQAFHDGETTLILWDARGRREQTITVVDSTLNDIGGQLEQVLGDLDFTFVQVRIEGETVFLIGEVTTDEELIVLEEMAAAYGESVVSLVRVKSRPHLEVVEELPPLVSLTVKVIELSRKDVEKLGVLWNSSSVVTEESMNAGSFKDTLLRIGETVSRNQFAWTINALVTSNKGRVLAEPKLVTISGKKAKSFIGVEVPVISATSIGSGSTASVNASIDFRETGILLTMIPTVHLNDPLRRITTKVTAEVSSLDTATGLQVPVGTSSILVPGFKVRKTTTEVTTQSGQTVIIAGLLSIDDSEAVNKVPGLGNIPIIGRLFRSPIIESTELEMIVAITAEIIGDSEKQVDRSLALEEALSVAQVTASVDDPRLRYALQVQQSIARRLRYPEREKELELDGMVKLRLHLFTDGTLGRAMVSESSGIKAFDMEAIKVAEAVAPYPGFPGDLKEEDMWLEVAVIFRP